MSWIYNQDTSVMTIGGGISGGNRFVQTYYSRIITKYLSRNIFGKTSPPKSKKNLRKKCKKLFLLCEDSHEIPPPQTDLYMHINKMVPVNHTYQTYLLVGIWWINVFFTWSGKKIATCWNRLEPVGYGVCCLLAHILSQPTSLKMNKIINSISNFSKNHMIKAINSLTKFAACAGKHLQLQDWAGVYWLLHDSQAQNIQWLMNLRRFPLSGFGGKISQ